MIETTLTCGMTEQRFAEILATLDAKYTTRNTHREWDEHIRYYTKGMHAIIVTTQPKRLEITLKHFTPSGGESAQRYVIAHGNDSIRQSLGGRMPIRIATELEYLIKDMGIRVIA